MSVPIAMALFDPDTTQLPVLPDPVAVRSKPLMVNMAPKLAEKQFDDVMNATRIIDGLNRHLDMEAGGQVALNLRDMYQAISKALLRSVGKTDAGEASDRLIEGLRTTRDAWAEISGMPKLN